MHGLFQKIKKIFELIHFNRGTLFGFELLFKLLTAMIAIPAGLLLTEFTLNITGYHYLTIENLSRFFCHPFVILGIVLLILMLSAYVIVDISALLFVIDRSYQKKKVTIFQTIRFALYNAKRVFSRENIGILFMLPVMLPFLNVGEFGILVTTMTIPSVITSLLEKNREYVKFLIILAILCYFFLMRWIFAFHYFTLEGKNCRESADASKKLSSGSYLKDAFTLGWVQLAFYLASSLVAAVGIVLVLGIAKLFSQLHLLNYVYTSAVWGLLIVVLLLVVAIGLPISFLAITLLFYLHKESSQEAVIHGSIIIQPTAQKHQRIIHTVEYGLCAVAVCAVSFMIYTISTQKVNPQVEYLRMTEVTAHRGASAFYPENTMAAFQGAVDFGADWIELDVQQSKDGQIFVMHDRNFKRTTGKDAISWELEYDEIAQLDAGSYFSPNFAGEKIPLLTDAIVFAKENNIRLNIEIKPSAMDVDMEKHVVDIIREMDFVQSCVVTSQAYSSLEKIKEYDEEIQTVYVMSFAYGKIHNLSAADAFSVEAASLNPTLVSRIHNSGKQVYAWTVNSKKKINRMIDLNVDNIITDRVALAQQCIYESKTSTVVQRYVEFLRER